AVTTRGVGKALPAGDASESAAVVRATGANQRQRRRHPSRPTDPKHPATSRPQAYHEEGSGSRATGGRQHKLRQPETSNDRGPTGGIVRHAPARREGPK